MDELLNFPKIIKLIFKIDGFERIGAAKQEIKKSKGFINKTGLLLKNGINAVQEFIGKAEYVTVVFNSCERINYVLSDIKIDGLILEDENSDFKKISFHKLNDQTIKIKFYDTNSNEKVLVYKCEDNSLNILYRKFNLE